MEPLNPFDALRRAFGNGSRPASYGAHEYTISDMARRFGLTLRTLRFYEDKGILKPRRIGQSRLYSARDVDVLTIALLCKRGGMTLAEIKGFLKLTNFSGAEPRARQGAQALRGARGDLMITKKEIQEAIEETRVMAALLSEIANAAETPSLEDAA